MYQFINTIITKQRKMSFQCVTLRIA